MTTGPLTSRLPAPLPMSVVRKIYAEMQGHYGSRFVDMWSTGQQLDDGTDAGMQDSMSMWAHKLGKFRDSLWRIRKVLNSLPQHPPTLPEFDSMCNAQQSDVVALPAPRLSADEIAPHIAEAARKVAAPRDDMLAWARTPPAPMYRGPWETLMIDAVQRGAECLREILRGHVESGVIKAVRAKEVLGARVSD